MSSSVDEHHDIQALLRGFDDTWPWAVFVYGTFSADADANRGFILELPGALNHPFGPSSVRDLDRSLLDPEFDGPFNVAFTFAGLSKLGISPEVLHSFPNDFTEGMRSRAYINGDNGLSNPKCWEQHWREGGPSVDFWVGIYTRSEQAGRERLERLRGTMQQHGLLEAGVDLAHRFLSDEAQMWIDDDTTQPAPGKPLEHFGFQDGISNPPVRGLSRPTFPATNGGGRLDDQGNWHPMAAGEFLYGYLDEIGEVQPSPMPSSLGENGTYLVLRKLSQDVDAFRKYLRETAPRYDCLTADGLAEKMVGRKRNGVPLVPSASTVASNDFVYRDDPDGMDCPLGSHVRRANPRDTLRFASLLVDRHRILRRAIPYGKPVPRDQNQADINPMVDLDVADSDCTGPVPGQGLLFLALNIDITRQFEFIQSQWVNFGNDLYQGSDRDPVVGNHDPKTPKHNRMVFPKKGDDPLVVCTDMPQFVTTRGGDYFFLPGIAAYSSIANNKYA